jgi:hypothetical protein
MKKLLCKFANWILRKCTSPVIAFNEDLYINGRSYKLSKATTELSPYAHTVINFEVVDGRE